MKLLQKFDPMNQTHVAWFKKLTMEMKDLTPKSFTNTVNNNPITDDIGNLKALDLPEIHMMLSVKYVNALFDNKAYIPPP